MDFLIQIGQSQNVKNETFPLNSSNLSCLESAVKLSKRCQMCSVTLTYLIHFVLIQAAMLVFQIQFTKIFYVLLLTIFFEF